jgi:hypothetical protein
MQSAQTPGEPVNVPTPPGEITGVKVPGGTLVVEQFGAGTERAGAAATAGLIAEALDGQALS